MDAELQPRQEAWREQDVAQCGCCRPRQIMAAVALVRRVAGSLRRAARSRRTTRTASGTSAAAVRIRGSARRSDRRGRRPGGCEARLGRPSDRRSGGPRSQHVLEEGAVPGHQLHAVHAEEALVPGHP
ncbi:2Fe-2S iron-sulfur cluster-binding protein [Streptomyces sp. OS603R]|uniref:2Fe-2S iron-sulfur cluster-binding protein n=1 Tax=Streptomyces sp. OS603R TaxID=3035287 RepID=UPI00325BEC52